ncbi:hypothetical protein [Geofilum rubicundum]|uniref:Uncharacterized protein n=1 Tax=Geofilum rubicundum JCM 15548 TaxID=1236989 RepID=A0A0E9M015_9BACT|nr:hypothetical protein [Geofilum rubicundum]GAO31167.1 hypothetical protein JCM15548_13506 [Geofilum rubicundum JCM 15548]
MNDSTRALKIKRRYERQWLSIDGVTAIGLGKDNHGTAIIVSYCTNPEGIKKAIPASVDRIPVIFQFSGTINAQDK